MDAFRYNLKLRTDYIGGYDFEKKEKPLKVSEATTVADLASWSWTPQLKGQLSLAGGKTYDEFGFHSVCFVPIKQTYNFFIL